MYFFHAKALHQYCLKSPFKPLQEVASCFLPYLKIYTLPLTIFIKDLWHNCTKKVGPSDKFHSNTVFCICDQIGCFFLLHIWYNHMLIPSASRHSQSYLPPKLQNASEKKIVWTWNLPWKGGDAPGATLNMSVQVLINFHFVEKKHYIIKMFLLLMLPCPLRHLDVVEVYCVPCAPYFVAFVSVRSYKSG